MKKIYLGLILCFAFVLFSNEAEASERLNAYYFIDENLAFDNAQKKALEFVSDFKAEEKAIILIDNLMKNANFPKNTRLISVSLVKGEMFVNFSPEIKNYGGTFEEIRIIKEIVYTLMEIQEIDCLTVHIDGRLDYFPEGTVIYRLDRTMAEGEIFCD